MKFSPSKLLQVYLPQTATPSSPVTTLPHPPPCGSGQGRPRASPTPLMEASPRGAGTAGSSSRPAPEGTAGRETPPFGAEEPAAAQRGPARPSRVPQGAPASLQRPSRTFRDRHVRSATRGVPVSPSSDPHVPSVTPTYPQEQARHPHPLSDPHVASVACRAPARPSETFMTPLVFLFFKISWLQKYELLPGI